MRDLPGPRFCSGDGSESPLQACSCVFRFCRATLSWRPREKNSRPQSAQKNVVPLALRMESIPVVGMRASPCRSKARVDTTGVDGKD